jgi:hypothetical protein
MLISELITNIKTRLGSPAINIEVTDEQVTILISDVLQKFIEFHFDGLDEGYYILTTEVNKQSYILPNNVYSVLDAASSTLISAGDPILLSPYNYTDISTTQRDIVDLTVFRENFAAYRSEMKEMVRFEFNSTTHILKFLEIPTTVRTVAFRCHLVPTDLESIYENRWFQKYATALTKLQWGNNLAKYTGGLLPSGASLNFDRIIDDAKQQIEELEEELETTYQEPVDFMIG